MKKKIVSAILSLALLFTMLPAGALAASITGDNDLTMVITGATIDETVVEGVTVGVLTLSGTCFSDQAAAIYGAVYTSDAYGNDTLISQNNASGSGTNWTITLQASKNAVSDAMKMTAHQSYHVKFILDGSGSSGNINSTANNIYEASFKKTGKDTFEDDSWFTVKTAQTTPVTVDLGSGAGTGVNATVGQAAVITAAAAGGDGDGDYQFKSSDTDVATVNASTGVVTILKAGSADISAMRKGNATYEDSTYGTAATLTVSEGTPTLAATTATATVTKNDTALTLADIANQFGFTLTNAAGTAIPSSQQGTVKFYSDSGASSEITTLDISSAGNNTIYAKADAKTNYYAASNIVTLTVTVSLGKAVTVDGTAAGGTVTYTGSLSGDLDSVSAQLTAPDAAAGLKVMDGTKEVTSGGTWTWTNGSTSLTAGKMSGVSLTWTPNGDIDGTTYAPTTSTATIYVKKQLEAGDFQASGTTLNKDYDASKALPAGAKAEVASQVNGQAYTVSIEGTYADANVGNGKVITTTTVTEDAPSDYYVLADSLSSLTGLTGNIAQVTPTLTLGNLSQTTGSVTQVTVSSAPTSTDLNATVKYEVPIASQTTVTAGNCTCNNADKLAHAKDCAYLVAYKSDPTTTTSCDCGSTSSAADPTTAAHQDSCTYAVASPGSHCNCSVRGGLTNVADHEIGCGAVVTIPATTEKLAWDDTPTDTTYASVSDYLNSLSGGSTVNVEATSAASTNLAAVTMPVTGTLQINAKSSGGGGGTTSYKVSFNVGDNGKITKGNASAYVNSGSKLTESKIPTVTANDGYKFLGWSLDGKTVVDPTEAKVTKAVTYTALYEKTGEPVEPSAEGFVKDRTDSYMNGYPDGTFRPQAGITRGEVSAVIARTILPEFPADGSEVPSYSDLSGHWASKYIGYLESLGVVTGYPDGSFKPDQTITRSEFVAIVIRVDGLVNGTNSFTDVNDSNWATKYIISAVEKAYVSGYPDGTFRPEQPITRTEAAKIMNAVLGWSDMAANGEMKFSDVATDFWGWNDILKASNGVVA
ncbi:S-layer homology domain-containing protein [Agathobaculum sp.]|uniref:S-layer homology domain-containing protein n=1 Tax=Agathobaculum sp. TaxID=2048138 RepID=UPI002A81AE62|nr:S-layer homology domain-containing protein [Agathobaculum sp.]MDY3617712.1 S-layer homology domain-containing protein [Agathobaculum sp.]